MTTTTTTPAAKRRMTLGANKPAAKTTPVATAVNKARGAPKPVDKAGKALAAQMLKTLAAQPAKKTAAKPVPAKKTAPAVKFVASKIKGAFFAVQADKRPQFGRALFAHTHAALAVLDMLDPKRPAAPKAALLTLCGQRVVDYHVRESNFEAVKDNGIKLTPTGLEKFQSRLADGRLDVDVANEYAALFVTGKPGPKLNIGTGHVFQTKIG